MLFIACNNTDMQYDNLDIVGRYGQLTNAVRSVIVHKDCVII
jgi:hypothetical protein